jgi:glycosyltransferase involved in cell wall biosynthesis
MTISLCVVAYNEEKVINNLLSEIKNQTYPHEFIEIILVDSNSVDATKQIMTDFSNEDNGFERVSVIDNPKRKQAYGWNIAINNSVNDIIIRVDAHASIPGDFVKKNVECIQSGEYVCGGKRPNIIDDETPWKKTLLLAESSMFGSSIANYRRGTNENIYVKSMFHAAYRREVFEKAGVFNENLGRTEDNEIHYRIRKNGYRLCYNPDIISYQHTRNSLKKMLRQKFANGYWVGLTLSVCPKCLSLFHFIPLVFVLGIIFTSVLAIAGFAILSYIMWAAYWLLSITMAVLLIRDENFNLTSAALPFLFFLLHVCYGAGTVAGIIKIPFWKFANWKKEMRND